MHEASSSRKFAQSSRHYILNNDNYTLNIKRWACRVGLGKWLALGDTHWASASCWHALGTSRILGFNIKHSSLSIQRWARNRNRINHSSFTSVIKPWISNLSHRKLNNKHQTSIIHSTSIMKHWTSCLKFEKLVCHAWTHECHNWWINVVINKLFDELVDSCSEVGPAAAGDVS